jgi:pimeloyl-ACP methyl ester carboxylesterase
MKPGGGFDPESIPVSRGRIGDIFVAYKDFGRGDPLVLINGFGATMDTWNPPILGALCDSSRVVLFDSRGMGYSGSSDKPYSIPLFARDTAGLMDLLGISRAHIIGFSLGGMIAQELALLHPEKVRSLVLVSTDCGGPHAERMSADVWKTLLDKSGDLREQAERMFSVLFPPVWAREHDPWDYCPEIHETTPEAHTFRQSETLFTWQGTYERLSEIRCPTMVITGTDDIIIPPENSFTLTRRIPAAWLVQVRNGGHGLAYQFPELFSRVVMTFLELH